MADKRYTAVGRDVLDRHHWFQRVSTHQSEDAAKRKARRLNRELKQQAEQEKSSPSYREGWNDAIDAAVQRLRNHDIDWLGDKSFSQMEAEIYRAVATLRKRD